MKSLLLISTFLLTLNFALSQAPDYFNNQPSWFIELQHSGEGGIGSYMETSVILAFENEIYDGYFLMKRKYEKVEYDDGTITAGTESLINVRQEGRAIYYYNEETELDELFISYELEIGDTVKGKFGDENFPLIVYDIDSVLVGDSYRRLFYTDETPEGGANRRLIEGIGFQYSDEVQIGNYFGDINYAGEGIGFDLTLNCYGEYTVPLWNYPEGGDCNLTLNLEEEETQTNINLYPNPAVDLINLSASTNIKVVTIQTLDGAIIKEVPINKNNGQINLTEFSKGIYIANITMENGTLLWKKIIKQ